MGYGHFFHVGEISKYVLDLEGSRLFHSRAEREKQGKVGFPLNTSSGREPWAHRTEGAGEVLRLLPVEGALSWDGEKNFTTPT